ncbi:hypothetical protein POM88_029374 [Heracleum sosnowskyi]|uniref:Uncharacterized protein n=1 Tax=Heracleum sosnowskyi TaxID=360622 RepID=A0AAD8HUL7_9APIA|nr:hypothetical protein POM88_029374 [Heracleum sosnowskyi]
MWTSSDFPALAQLKGCGNRSIIPDQAFLQIVQTAVTNAQANPDHFGNLNNSEMEEVARNIIEVSDPASRGSFNQVFFREVVNVVTTIFKSICNEAQKLLKEEIDCKAGTSQGNEGVFVTDTSSFVISDDLHVIPNNPTSILKMLESSGIENFAALEENTIQLGFEEFIHLLESSFSSQTPLSDIFFGTKSMNSQVPSIESPIPTRCDDSSKKMKVEIYVQKSTNRILSAHCSEDFIDFLFSLLTIPLGKVISLLNKNHESTLCIENMHHSVVELNVHEYLLSEKLKDKLLNPKLARYYPGFFKELTDESTKIDGFVRGPTKFLVTDDLFVSPLSSMSCFTYLQSLKVPPSDIEEQVINIGMNEASELLSASLTSTSVISNGLKFFIQKNAKQESEQSKV